jgi:hypothetical protein
MEFVIARAMRSSNDTSFVQPTQVGTLELVVEWFNIYRQNPSARIPREYYTWMYCFYCFFKRPIILDANVQVPRAATASCPSILDQVVVATAPNIPTEIATEADFCIVNNQALVSETRLLFGSAVTTPLGKTEKLRIQALVPKVVSRLSHFKSIYLPDSPSIQHHWAIDAFVNNLPRLCEFVGVMR